mgnify:FL=1
MNRKSVVNSALNIFGFEVKKYGNERYLCDTEGNYLGIIDGPLWSTMTNKGEFSIKMINDEKSRLKYCVSLVNEERAINMAISLDGTKEFEIAVYNEIDDSFGRLFISNRKLNGQITRGDEVSHNFEVSITENVSKSELETKVSGVSFDQEFSFSKNRKAKDILTRDIIKKVNLMDLFDENADVFDEFNKILMDLEEMAPGVREFVLDNSILGKLMYNEVGSKVLIAK